MIFIFFGNFDIDDEFMDKVILPSIIISAIIYIIGFSILITKNVARKNILIIETNQVYTTDIFDCKNNILYDDGKPMFYSNHKKILHCRIQT